MSGIVQIAGPQADGSASQRVTVVDLGGGQYALLVQSSGGGGGGGTSSAFDVPFPADGTAAGFLDDASGRMVPGRIEGGYLQVSCQINLSDTATDPTQTTVGTSAAQALPANARKAISIQNQGTTIIYVLLGNGTPSASKYTVALPACGTANDGSSAAYTGPPGVVWAGAVQWISSASGGLATAVELI